MDYTQRTSVLHQPSRNKVILLETENNPTNYVSVNYNDKNTNLNEYGEMKNQRYIEYIKNKD